MTTEKKVRARLHTPEELWKVDQECLDQHEEAVREGTLLAAQDEVAVVTICRDAMPHLPNTLLLVDCVASQFKDFRHYVYENDSEDGSAEALDTYDSVRPWVTVEHGSLGGLDDRGAWAGARTERLALCRNKCLDWVRDNAPNSKYTVVLDADPHFGWSPDGLFSSISWLHRLPQAGGMASFSLYMTYKDDGRVSVAQYDSWAARLNWWRDRREECGYGWFSMLLPPVGSPPIPMNSAFGGLCVYRTEAFLSGGYSGEDCEHVTHHRRMAENGWKMYMNPGCLYGAYLARCDEG
jgi:hypothetical protein